MADPSIARKISEAIRSNQLVHPGDPDNDKPPMPLVLPMFNTAGMEPEMAKLVTTTSTVLAEAIVAFIETRCESKIVSDQQVDDMLAAQEAPAGTRVLPVHCSRCDRRCTDPLMMLTVDARPRISVDGAQLIGALSQRSVECPHGRG